MARTRVSLPKLAYIPLDKIDLPADQPRKHFDDAALKELTASIKERGILQPLLLRPASAGRYELIAGERRLRAARKLKLLQVPAVVEVQDDNTAWENALIENLQREDLSQSELVYGVLRHLSNVLQDDAEVKAELEKSQDSYSAIARILFRVGKRLQVGRDPNSKLTKGIMAALERVQVNFNTFVKTELESLAWPADVKMAVEEGKVSKTAARQIARMPEKEARAKQIADPNLTVRAVAAARKAGKAGTPPPPTPVSKREPSKTGQLGTLEGALLQARVVLAEVESSGVSGSQEETLIGVVRDFSKKVGTILG